MKSSSVTIKTMVLLVSAAVLVGYLAAAGGAVERTREYEITVPPYQSDTARMIAAYERLSDQYLTLVGRHLAGLDSSDRMILQKLEALEKKLDELGKKVDRLSGSNASHEGPSEEGRPAAESGRPFTDRPGGRP